MVDYDVYHRLCVILYLKVSEDSITYDIMAAASFVLFKIKFQNVDDFDWNESKLLTFIILSHKCSTPILIHQSFIL